MKALHYNHNNNNNNKERYNIPFSGLRMNLLSFDNFAHRASKCKISTHLLISCNLASIFVESSMNFSFLLFYILGVDKSILPC